MKGTTGHTQPKNVASDSTFTLWLSPCKILRYIWTPPRDVVDQRDMHSDWLRAFCTEEKEYQRTGESDFSQKCSFCRIINSIVLHHFRVQKTGQ